MPTPLQNYLLRAQDDGDPDTDTAPGPAGSIGSIGNDTIGSAIGGAIGSLGGPIGGGIGSGIGNSIGGGSMGSSVGRGIGSTIGGLLGGFPGAALGGFLGSQFGGEDSAPPGPDVSTDPNAIDEQDPNSGAADPDAAPDDNEDDDEEGDQSCCFTAETLILMADGSSKAISKVSAGDMVSDGSGGENKVIKVKQTVLGKRTLASVCDFAPFMSSDHPLKTESGWRAVRPNPELHPGLGVARMSAYATLETADGPKAVGNITETDGDPDLPLYDLDVDDDDIYVANGIIAHNCGGAGGGGGSGGGCFVAGTRILTPAGSVNIEDLSVGDVVLSFPKIGGKFNTPLEPDKVASLQCDREPVYRLNGVGTTAEEFLIMGDGTALAVKNIRVGDTIITQFGPWQVHSIEIQAPATVYNFMTEKNFSFVAGGIRTARGAAVTGKNLATPTTAKTMAEAYEMIFGAHAEMEIA